MSLRLLAVPLALLSLSSEALAEEDYPLAVPEGYELIAETTPPQFIKTDHTRRNMIGNERTTSAILLGFTNMPDGTDIYAIREFVAWCESGRLHLRKVQYVSADQKLLGTDDKVAFVKVTPDTLEATVYNYLCDDWDEKA